MVLVDQFIDRTFHRPSTFFGEGLVGHVSFGDPVSKVMVESLTKACDSVKATYHKGGTYICMEGPQFSTRAESNLYRSWGASVIGMTNIQEAKLAREAEISFASLSMATDYDCWHEEEVNAQAVVATLMKNIATSKKILSAFLQNPPSGDCEHQHALKHALVTDKQMIPEATKKKLQLLVGKYL
jgi:5'-methylthioadenosine phosphorylase